MSVVKNATLSCAVAIDSPFSVSSEESVGFIRNSDKKASSEI